MSGRVVKVGGVAAVGAAAYYLYSAGGDPKLAEKKAEHDASRLTSKIKSELPGKKDEFKTKAQEAGAKLDQVAADFDKAAYNAKDSAKSYAADASKRIEETKKEVGSKLMTGVDKFDHTVEKQSANAKGWFSSWFGSSK